MDVECTDSISTKSSLILRDAELLKQFKDISVAMSINTLDESFKNDVYTDQTEHTARRFSAWLPPIQCTLSGH